MISKDVFETLMVAPLLLLVWVGCAYVIRHLYVNWPRRKS